MSYFSTPRRLEWSIAQPGRLPESLAHGTCDRRATGTNPSGMFLQMVRNPRIHYCISLIQLSPRGTGSTRLTQGACEKCRFLGPRRAFDLESPELEPTVCLSPGSPPPTLDEHLGIAIVHPVCSLQFFLMPCFCRTVPGSLGSAWDRSHSLPYVLLVSPSSKPRGHLSQCPSRPKPRSLVSPDT